MAVAVREADDDAVTTRPARRPARSTLLAVVGAVSAVLIVACVGVLAARFVATTDSEASFGGRLGQVVGFEDAAGSGDLAATRERVLSRASQFVLRLNTYGPDDLNKQNKMPGYVERVSEVMTSKFQAGFEKNVTIAEQSVAQAGYSRNATLIAAGSESVEDDKASVLVAATYQSSYPDPQEKGRVQYGPSQLRWQVSMVRTRGEWLVDGYQPVTGEAEQQPTLPPSTGGQDSGGQGGQGGGDQGGQGGQGGQGDGDQGGQGGQGGGGQGGQGGGGQGGGSQ